MSSVWRKNKERESLGIEGQAAAFNIVLEI